MAKRFKYNQIESPTPKEEGKSNEINPIIDEPQEEHKNKYLLEEVKEEDSKTSFIGNPAFQNSQGTGFFNEDILILFVIILILQSSQPDLTLLILLFSLLNC